MAIKTLVIPLAAGFEYLNSKLPVESQITLQWAPLPQQIHYMAGTDGDTTRAKSAKPQGTNRRRDPYIVDYRLKGINAPEVKSAKDGYERVAGIAAANYLEHLQKNARTLVVSDESPDAYGRTAVYLWYKDSRWSRWNCANEKILEAGLAVPYRNGERSARPTVDWERWFKEHETSIRYWYAQGKPEMPIDDAIRYWAPE